MDKNIKSLQHNISMALRSVPNEKTFDGIYQDGKSYSKNKHY